MTRTVCGHENSEFTQNLKAFADRRERQGFILVSAADLSVLLTKSDYKVRFKKVNEGNE